ncbi:MULTISPECIES: hypothetical protein [unclassified Cryobacterium]|uniref:hypothetical protein n=1 Tax=unclassified Cryobacterium TaxID=2649013 RepID=UPI00106A9ADF|nr:MULTISPECIES: hypothetical protein [unclassified Cryobacterium]TFB96550.1 hypothetical protein E3O39_10790 [Cryobacterium sp. MDB2-A-1]TFC12834.1 hypothetical protein E3O35_07950 [Cryobacterium sp. MDB2-A-2]
MTQSIAPKTDQINAADLVSGPITVTINRVTEGPPEQPFNFHMEETPGRAYRPSKSMRRVMVAAWGSNPAAYVGHSLTIYRNPDTKFGKERLGGIEISHMSHISKPTTVALTVTRGKRAPFTVKPLATTAPTPPADTSGREWLTELTLAADNLDAVSALFAAAKQAHAPAETVAAIRAVGKRISDAGKAGE